MNLRRIAPAAVTAALAGVLSFASTAPPARAQCTYYSIDTLSSYGVVANPVDIQLQQTQSVWSAFAVRPVAGEDWDVTLYQNSAAYPTCVTNYLAGSSYGGSIVDFVIGDYSHDPPGTYYARCNQFSGTNFAYVRWCESPQVMTVNGVQVARTWNVNDVMETWNVQLSAGTTYTVYFSPYGLSAKLLLFRNPSSGTYWAGRGSAELSSSGTTTYTAPTTGTYAVVVVNDDGGTGGFSLSIGTCVTPTALSSGTALHTGLGNSYYQFTQSAAYWTAVGVRSTSADYDVDAYGGTGGAWPFCFSDPKASSLLGPGVVDFVIGDFNHNPTGTYGAYSNAYAIPNVPPSADVEWDSGTDLLSVNGTAISRTSDTTNVIEVWDVFLTAGQTYNFAFRPSASNLHMLLFRNTGGGVYWAGRAGAQFDVTGCQTYTAPTSGYYGVVVTNETGASATYTLGVSQAPCACAAEVGSEITYVANSGDNYYSFTQPYWGYWSVFATRGQLNTADWDLTVAGSSTGNPAPTCLGNTLVSSAYGAGLVDIGVIDFSYAPLGTYYARAHQFSGGSGLVEYDASHGVLFHNGRVQSWTMAPFDLVHAFNAFMEAGKTYVLDFAPSDVTIKLLVFENPGTSAYYVSRAAAVLTTSGVITYTPTVTGYHGLVVVNDAAVNGSYSIRFGSCTTAALGDGVPVVASEALNTYSIAQHGSSWGAVGVRSGTVDWDIRLSAIQTGPFPNCLGATLAGSASAALGYVDFVTGDFFHNAPGTYYVESDQYTDAPVVPSNVQWNAGSGELIVNGAGAFTYISPGEMLHSWTVNLTAGVPHTFYFSQLSTSNLHMLLFRNPGGGSYWTGRGSAVVDLTPGMGSITYTPPSSGEYGAVVVKDDEVEDWYTLVVEACFPPAPLAGGTSVRDSVVGFHSFNQAALAWTAVGVRANTGGIDWDLDVYSNPGGGTPGICQSDLLGNSILLPPKVDFVVGDFNVGGSLPGTSYVRTSGLGLTTASTTEWDSGTDQIALRTPIYRATGPSDVLEIWDVFLQSGQTYGVLFSHTGAADVKLMIFHNPGGTYWAGRNANVYEQSTSGNYTAPATGWYGVVVVNDNGAPGNYTLGFSQSALAVQPDQAPHVTALAGIQPNPARSRMSIEYSLSKQAPVRLQMIDLAGRVVAEVENQTHGAGVWHAGWDGLTKSGDKAAPGIYMVRLEVDGQVIGQRKVTLLE